MKPAELTAEEQTAILAERYSQRAEAYDKFWSPVIRPAGERLVSQLPLGSASSIIDVGTGTGALLPAIARAALSATILGVDRSEGMLRLARKKVPRLAGAHGRPKLGAIRLSIRCGGCRLHLVSSTNARKMSQ